MPITLKTNSFKFRDEPSDEWSGALVQAVTDLEPAMDRIDEVEDTLDQLEDDVSQLAIQSSVIVSNSFTNPISCIGLTANHVVCNWGLFSDAQCTTPISPNNPPADITIEEGTDQFNLTIQNSTGTFYLKPTFILP